MSSTGSFPTTHWSQVARAGGDSPKSRRVALEELLRRYLAAFRAHVIRVLHVPPGDADDLVQGFVCDRIVAEELIAGADRSRGKFRTYLLTALDRHVARVKRYDGARKRRPDSPPASLDEISAGPTLHQLSPAESFDLAWARQVIAQAIDQMRKECSSRNRADIWGVFEGRVLSPMLDGTAPTPCEQLVQTLCLVSAEVAANLLVTGKRMFARSLRSVVAQYLRKDADIDQEIVDLRRILAGGRR